MSSFLDFEYSPEQQLLQASLRRFLADACPISEVRHVLEGREQYSAGVWAGLGRLGCLGAAIPEDAGGLGLGVVEMCLMAGELGRVLAPVPSVSCLYLFAPVILAAGSPGQQQHLLPALADGRLIGTVADIELSPQGRARQCETRFEGGRLSGVKSLVPDARIASCFLVTALEASGGERSLFLVSAEDPSITCDSLQTIDPSRPYARVTYCNVPAERIGEAGQAHHWLEEAKARAALFVACEQVAGAQRALEHACDYAKSRHAFGRPIGSFQAVKQLLADMFVSLSIAQANVEYAAWAASSGSPDARLAAMRAHLSATRAFRHCSADAIQVHGGAGFMWDVDMHLYYRRSELLAQNLSLVSDWEACLVRERAAQSEGVAA